MYDQYDEGMNMYDDGGNYYHKGSRKNRKRKRKLQQEESFIVDIEQRYIQAKHKKNKRLNTSSSSTTVSTNDIEVGTSSGKWNDDKNNVDKNVNNDIKKKKKKKKINNTNKSEDNNYNNNNKKKKKNNGITFQPLKKGIQYFDFKIGNGEAIKRGKKIEVKYIGRLTNHNGKVFDQGNIKFRVGSGEVISGWDIGIIGMKLNGKRRLLIPPKCGYGRHKQSGIPGNSTLCFDVSILKIM